MAEANTHELGFLAKLVVVAGIVLLVAGVAWYGITFAVIERLWTDLIERPTGPMKFRFVLQPLMATIAAIIHGRQDAQRGRSPYFWTMVRSSQERAARLREGLNATARIILLGLVMDVIYQIIVLKTFYPVEALIIAVVLAFVPYVVIRGIITRFARRPRASVSAGPN